MFKMIIVIIFLTDMHTIYLLQAIYLYLEKLIGRKLGQNRDFGFAIKG